MQKKNLTKSYIVNNDYLQNQNFPNKTTKTNEKHDSLQNIVY